MGKHYLVNDSLFYADNPYVAKNPYLTMEAEDTPLPTYADAKNDEIVWRVNLTEAHGIEKYPFGGKFVDLLCEARESAAAEPVITVTCDSPVKVHVIWEGGEKVV